MKFVGLMVVVTLAYCSVSSANKIKTENEVYVLNEDNYKKAIGDFKKLLIIFYAPWCKACQRVHPEIDRAAAVLHGMKSEAKIGKLDCIANKQTCRDFKIKFFPTMKIFNNGAATDYTGAPGWDSIVKALTE